MKYCIDFQKGFRYINDVDEITIIYRRKDTSLIDFLLEHQKQRINIYIKDEEDFLEYNCIKIFDAMIYVAVFDRHVLSLHITKEMDKKIN